jgi:hypothetical protein
MFFPNNSGRTECKRASVRFCDNSILMAAASVRAKTFGSRSFSRFGGGPGTDVMILKNIFAEKFGENIGVFPIISLVFEKSANFSQKNGKNRRKL